MRLLIVFMLALTSLNSFATNLDDQKAEELALECERYADRFNADWDFTLRSTHVKKCLLGKRISVLGMTKKSLEQVPAGAGKAYIRARMRVSVIKSMIQELRQERAGNVVFMSIAKIKAALATDIGEYSRSI